MTEKRAVAAGAMLLLALCATSCARNEEDTITFVSGDRHLGTISRDPDGGVRITLPDNSKIYAARDVDARAQATLRNAATAMEVFFTEHDSYVGAEPSTLPGLVPEEGVEITILEATREHFKLRATAAGGTAPSWTFDSRTSKVVAG